MTYASLVMSVGALVLGGHAVLYALRLRFYNQGLALIRGDRVDEWNALQANPPWYIRYTDWLESNLWERRKVRDDRNH